MLTYHTIPWVLDSITLYFEDEALVGLNFGDFAAGKDLRNRLQRYLPVDSFTEQATPASIAAALWLEDYASGLPAPFELSMKLYGTAFQKKVWQQLQKIPRGTTISYAQLGEQVGSNSVQALGTAVGKNPIPIILPCHRVLRADGRLGSYSAGKGSETKRQLLEMEGLTKF